jgi:PhnB protein
MVKPIPEGFSAVTPYLVVADVRGQIDFLVKAFGAMVNVKMELPGGAIGHADVIVFGSHVMMGQAGPGHQAMPAMLYLYVEDADAVHAKALAAGGALDQPMKDQFYGDRSGSVKDLNGNLWWIATHKEDMSDEELRRRMTEAHAARKGEAK